MLRVFGNDLAALRRSKGLSVGQLATRLGCHPSYITHVEKGTSASMKKINRANLLRMRLDVPDFDTQEQALDKLQQSSCRSLS